MREMRKTTLLQYLMVFSCYSEYFFIGFVLLKVQSITDGDVTEVSLSGSTPWCIFGLPYAIASLWYGVDMVIVHPMQAEDGRLLEPRIHRLHPIPFSHILSPF